MTREQLQQQLELTSKINSNEKFSADLQLRNYIELRLIADALTNISTALRTIDFDNFPITIADILQNTYENKS
jgi:hypothetical protein